MNRAGPGPARSALERVVRQEWGRLTALLQARFRRLDLVEDALADAVEAAARRWPTEGVPGSPAAWLNLTAQRRILDRFRGEAMAHRKLPLLIADTPTTTGGADMVSRIGDVEDDLLRLILMCAHPALAPEAAAALSLRLVLGVSTADIARLFHVGEPAMVARITRAKRKIVTAGISFAIPDAVDLPERLGTVAQVAYLGFTAGYAPGSGDLMVRADLAGEAIRLVRVALALRPADPTLVALLALMMMQHSRRAARVDDDGELVLLNDQDRSRWHHEEIDQALELLRHHAFDGAITRQAAGYLVQARIAAEHATAVTPELTRWDEIVRQFDLLLRLAPSPGAQLARAVAVAEADGPLAGLATMRDLEIAGSHRVPAVRAELLGRAGNWADAVVAYDRAIELCRNQGELRYLTRRRDRARLGQG